MKKLFVTIALIAPFLLCAVYPANAQRRDDTRGAITGADPTAPATTGIGQAVTPIIPSSLSPAPASKRELEETVPYPRATPSGVEEKARVKGSYYGEDVKTKGEYYQEGARVKGKYEIEGLPSKPETKEPGPEKPIEISPAQRQPTKRPVVPVPTEGE